MNEDKTKHIVTWHTMGPIGFFVGLGLVLAINSILYCGSVKSFEKSMFVY